MPVLSGNVALTRIILQSNQEKKGLLLSITFNKTIWPIRSRFLSESLMWVIICSVVLMSSDLGGINSVFLEDVFVKSTLSRYLDIITKLTLALPFSHAIIYTPMHTHTRHSQIQDKLVFWMLKIKCPENVFQEVHYYCLLLSIIVKRNSASWGTCNHKNISYIYCFRTLPHSTL